MKTKVFISCSLMAIIFFLSACSTVVDEVLEVEQKQIEFFQPKTETVDFFNEIIEEFESENPNINIHQVNVPDGIAVLKTRIARGNTPDIFITYPIEQDYIVRATKGYLLDLTNETFIEHIDPDIQNRYLVNGKMYGVALSSNAVGVIYNKQIFEDFDLGIPQTWDEFIEGLVSLKAAGEQPILMANKELESISVFNLNLIASEFNSMYWDKLNTGEVQVQDDERWQKVSEKMLQVLDFAQEHSFSFDSDLVNQAFVDGEGAMFVDGVWMLPRLEKLNPQINYGIFPFPATNDPERNLVLGGVDGGFAISADTKYPEEAKLFLEFLTRQENAQKFSDYEGNVSAVLKVEMNKKEVSLLADYIKQGKAVNWPNHYWSGGTAAEEDFRKISQQFFLEHDIDAYLKRLEIMFGHYRDFGQEES